MKIFYTRFLLIFSILTATSTVNAQHTQAFDHSILEQLTHLSTAQSRRVSSSDANFNGNGDSKEIMPGETFILADLEGPGIIKHIWNTTASLNPFYPNALILRIYWDNAEKPSIEVPLGDFFGVGHGKNKDLESLPISVSSLGRSRSCFWDMPFKKHAKITLTNEMQGFGPFELYYYVDWEKVKLSQKIYCISTQDTTNKIEPLQAIIRFSTQPAKEIMLEQSTLSFKWSMDGSVKVTIVFILMEKNNPLSKAQERKITLGMLGDFESFQAPIMAYPFMKDHLLVIGFPLIAGI